MAEITLSDLLAWEPRLSLTGVGGAGSPGGGPGRIGIGGGAIVPGLASGPSGLSGTAGPSGPSGLTGPTGAKRWATELEREITWAVTARASSPMLPPLRGGELVVLPRRVLIDSGVSLSLLLRELASHSVVAIVLEQPLADPPPLPALLAVPTSNELEGEINRLLTERRGELYRAGTEVERILSDLTTTGADLDQVLGAAAGVLGVAVTVTDARGNPLSAGGRAAPSGAARQGGQDAPGGDGWPAGAGWHGDRLGLPLTEGHALWIGPVPPARRALARLVGDRVGAAAASALRRAAEARPRGPARVAALNALLGAVSLDEGVRALTLGLPPDATYRVALAAADVGPAELHRRLAPLGVVHDAGVLDGLPAVVVEGRPETLGGANGTGRRLNALLRTAPLGPVGGVGVVAGTSAVNGANGHAHASLGQGGAAGANGGHGAYGSGPGGAGGWLALSGPVAGPAHLPAAGREARYVAALLGGGKIAGPVVRFDLAADLGPYRLLYRLWDAPELHAYSAEALGELPARDRRGTLRETLLVYLEVGGSHVDAAGRLGIHRNTLAYRLRQIADATGRDPADPSTRLFLHLALLAANLPPAPAPAAAR